MYKEINQEENEQIDENDNLNENNNENDNNNNENNNENNINEESNKIFNDNFEYINESNISNYEFCDLVIPIVGYQVHYPKNDIKNFIEELLKKDEITLNDFKYNNNNKNFNSPGYFRKVIEKPLNNITYEFLHHDEADEDLQNPFYNIEEHPHPKGNKFTSIRIIFQLPQSTYATMLFREISKNSSAGNFQANLSKNIKNNLI